MSSARLGQFRQALATEPAEKLLAEHVFGGEIFAFRKDPQALERLTAQMASGLRASGNAFELIVVGSARTGFSMSPTSPFKPFHPKSDIDLIVISSELFDQAWRILLDWNYSQPERHWPRNAAGKWVGQRRDDLWWGYLKPAEWTRVAQALGLLRDPDALKAFAPLRDHSTIWFNVFAGLAKDRTLGMRTVNGRLYRTRDHAALYHIDSLNKLRAAAMPAGS